MGSDPFSHWGLRSVELTDQPLLDSYFQSIQQPLSDYTFSQLFSWSNSLRILWKLIGDHLCVFANGTGDLTLLMPPIGQGSAMRALEECWGLMHAYNSSAGCPEQSRVEYASDELLAQFDRQRLDVVPMGVDYLYDTQRMIDLAGGDLASKRQLKNLSCAIMSFMLRHLMHRDIPSRAWNCCTNGRSIRISRIRRMPD